MKIFKKIWKAFDGKKTVIGGVSWILWVAVYAMPAFGPNYNWIVQYGTQIRDFLIANGVQLDNVSFNTATIATILGLLDKFYKKVVKPSADSQS